MTSQLERIVDAIGTAVSGIDGTGVFQTTLGTQDGDPAFYRTHRSAGEIFGDHGESGFPACAVTTIRQLKQYPDSQGKGKQVRAEIGLTWYVHEDASPSLEEEIHKVMSDCEAAIEVDPTLGREAMTAWVSETLTQATAEEINYQRGQVVVSVDFRHQRGDPQTGR